MGEDRNPPPSTAVVRATSLGLNELLVKPHVTSISQLPEVANVLSQEGSISTSQQIEALHRAEDIFASFARGGSEHVAVLSLLAEIQQSQLNDFKGAQVAIEQINNFIQGQSATVQSHVGLALAKTFWMQGDFATCVDQTEKLKKRIIAQESDLPVLHVASLENAHVLGTLMYEGPMAAKNASLTVDSVGLPIPYQAAQCLNMGVVEAYLALRKDCQGDSTCFRTRYEEAKEIWQHGIDLLHQDSSSSLSDPFALAVEGRLQSNLAYAILEIAGQSETHIAMASGHAREALQALEQVRNYSQSSNTPSPVPDEAWTRALSLVAQCYHRAGNAVTAEGLLQSALDESHQTVNLTPTTTLERISAYRAYAALCRDWEKRQGDSKRFVASATSLEEHLEGGWKEATELHSSLWFWMPSYA
jgi:tetratricopeptide (TPR) repeat protein